jgi:hypothetical protein
MVMVMVMMVMVKMMRRPFRSSFELSLVHNTRQIAGRRHAI